MTDYDPDEDSRRSYDVAIAALRERRLRELEMQDTHEATASAADTPAAEATAHDDSHQAYARLIEAIDLLLVNWREQERGSLGENNVDIMFGAASVMHRQWVLLAASALGAVPPAALIEFAPPSEEAPAFVNADGRTVFGAYAERLRAMAGEMIESAFAHGRTVHGDADA